MTSDVSDAQLRGPDCRGSRWVSFSGWGGQPLTPWLSSRKEGAVGLGEKGEPRSLTGWLGTGTGSLPHIPTWQRSRPGARPSTAKGREMCSVPGEVPSAGMVMKAVFKVMSAYS